MRKYSKRLGRLVLALIFAMALCLLSGVSADAKEYVLKLGHDQTVNHPYDLGCKKMKII